MRYLLAFILAFGAAAAWADGMVPLEGTYTFTFNTVAPSTGAPITLAGTPTIEVYEDSSDTQITAADTLSVDFDSVTGLHHVAIAATTANGFEEGKYYHCVIAGTTPTADSVSVAGRTVARFRVTTLVTTAGIQTACEAALAQYIGTDTVAEPTDVPPDAPTLQRAIMELYATLCFKSEQTATEYSQYRADGSTKRYERTTSDDDTTFTKGEARTPD